MTRHKELIDLSDYPDGAIIRLVRREDGLYLQRLHEVEDKIRMIGYDRVVAKSWWRRHIIDNDPQEK